MVVPCGISQHLTPDGNCYSPGYPYLLHVGNTKAHKNISRLIEAFAQANIDTPIHLILTGKCTLPLTQLIKKYRLENRVIFSGNLSEKELVEYYRGALALTFPSLYEGFGLPPLEAMACGTPVLTSNITSLPETVGDAAVLIDPYNIDSIKTGIEQITQDTLLRKNLIEKGHERITLFSWDKTAAAVQTILNNALMTL
jgi:glycosyltransferase involved in cell wall biosynthesis